MVFTGQHTAFQSIELQRKMCAHEHEYSPPVNIKMSFLFVPVVSWRHWPYQGLYLFNRPGVGGAVLQSASSLINQLIN